MTKCCIDTNVYVAFRRNDAHTVQTLRRFEFIGLDVAVIAELHAGFKLGGREQENVGALERFLDTPRVAALDHNIRTAEFYALIVKQLRIKGTPIPTNDIWIAATALAHGMGLFTLDSHFRQIDGLMLVE